MNYQAFIFGILSYSMVLFCYGMTHDTNDQLSGSPASEVSEFGVYEKSCVICGSKAPENEEDSLKTLFFCEHGACIHKICPSALARDNKKSLKCCPQCRALRRDSTKVVQRYDQIPFNISDVFDRDSVTQQHVITSGDDVLERICSFVVSGGNPNACICWGSHRKLPLLHIAASEGSLEVVRFLVYNGATVKAKGYVRGKKNSTTALDVALKKGFMEVVEYLRQVENNSDEQDYIY